MSEPSPTATDLVRVHAQLLLQRERELAELRVARERDSAWLHVFHSLSVESQSVTATRLCEQWAIQMIRQLQFQTAAVLQHDPVTDRFRLVAGRSQAPLPPVIRFEPQAQALLAQFPDGICSTPGDPEFAPLAEGLGLACFMWSLLSAGPGPRHLLVIGYSAAAVAFQPMLSEDDFRSFQMLSRHISVLLSNGRLIAELERERRQLQVMNAQYVVANRELEAFSYSVSHDLRAPLRSIDGFSQALLQDCADQLDAAGQDYAHRVRAAAQRMGELIDDLLQLSRVSRAGLTKQEVDLSALARAVLGELGARDSGRSSEITIEDDMRVQADPHLMRILLDNLLGNAWKFTLHAEKARIDVAKSERDGGTVYRVRDNGAGFNMKYAERLFRPFQRLHSPADFPGTGIGLATVHRIIDRHAGRVWAEGTPGQGATFYFTIPSDDEGAFR